MIDLKRMARPPAQCVVGRLSSLKLSLRIAGYDDFCVDWRQSVSKPATSRGGHRRPSTWFATAWRTGRPAAPKSGQQGRAPDAPGTPNTDRRSHRGDAWTYDVVNSGCGGPIHTAQELSTNAVLSRASMKCCRSHSGFPSNSSAPPNGRPATRALPAPAAARKVQDSLRKATRAYLIAGSIDTATSAPWQTSHYVSKDGDGTVP
jgi:hypothetical protein